jgi:guanylate kinase
VIVATDRGILFVISAPSGTGKSTLARKVLESTPELEFSVSYTTRPRREAEVDGREYHFVDRARFDAMIGAGEFLEWAEVFGQRYGTGREPTRGALSEGRDLLLDIDVQGARQVRRSGQAAVFVFVMPPDFATLEARLRARGARGRTSWPAASPRRDWRRRRSAATITWW